MHEWNTIVRPIKYLPGKGPKDDLARHKLSPSALRDKKRKLLLLPRLSGKLIALVLRSIAAGEVIPVCFLSRVSFAKMGEEIG
jgi:hypothetical protein